MASSQYFANYSEIENELTSMGNPYTPRSAGRAQPKMLRSESPKYSPPWQQLRQRYEKPYKEPVEPLSPTAVSVTLGDKLPRLGHPGS